MSTLNTINHKIYSAERLNTQVICWKKSKKRIVFTNGCFDILHKGHVNLLMHAADMGDKLIVGINSDRSIQQLKGENRPIISEKSRSIVLASLSFVDAVVVFSEKTPYELIKNILPNVLVKGGDYNISDISGNDIIQNNGGHVVIIPLIKGFSSTNIINKIKVHGG